MSQIHEREASVKAQLLCGVPMKVLVRRYGLTWSTVRRWRKEACDEVRAQWHAEQAAGEQSADGLPR